MPHTYLLAVAFEPETELPAILTSGVSKALKLHICAQQKAACATSVAAAAASPPQQQSSVVAMAPAAATAASVPQQQSVMVPVAAAAASAPPAPVSSQGCGSSCCSCCLWSPAPVPSAGCGTCCRSKNCYCLSCCQCATRAVWHRSGTPACHSQGQGLTSPNTISAATRFLAAASLCEPSQKVPASMTALFTADLCQVMLAKQEV